jgi:hypothetical protein
MDGLTWMIKNALQAAGVTLDPQEISNTIDTAKILIPKISQQFQTMIDNQIRMERKLDMLLASNSMPTVQSLKDTHGDSEIIPVPVPHTKFLPQN